jgi:hypothetical protein
VTIDTILPKMVHLVYLGIPVDTKLFPFFYSQRYPDLIINYMVTLRISYPKNQARSEDSKYIRFECFEKVYVTKS